MKLETLLTAIVATYSSVAGQDMIGVDWNGDLYALDSYTGASEPIGFGLYGQNCLARDAGGALWSSARLGVNAPPGGTDFLSRVDPVSGTAVAMFPSRDLRGLAAGSGNDLYAAVHEGGASTLYRFDTATGSETRIGATGFGSNAIVALAMHNGQLYAWDLNLGLGVLDPVSGAFTDVNRAVNGGLIHWLAERSDGQLIGGWFSLFAIDTATGVATAYAQTTGMRGAVRSPLAGRFGVGCDGGTGIVSLDVSGAVSPGGMVTLTSTGHTPFARQPFGISVLGFSRIISQGAALPVSLDPIVGTVGCSLYVSVDTFQQVGLITSSQVVLQHTFVLPPIYHDYTFFAQHFALDQVPGGISASNGVVIHVAD